MGDRQREAMRQACDLARNFYDVVGAQNASVFGVPVWDWGVGCGVWRTGVGLGFRVWSLGSGIQTFRSWGVRFRLWGLGFEV